MKNSIAVLFGVVAASESTKHWNGGRYGYWMINCPDVMLRQCEEIEVETKFFTKEREG